MLEIEIEIVVMEGFGNFHKESILDDLKTSEGLKGLKSEVTIFRPYREDKHDRVKVRLCGDAVSKTAIKEFVDWTCQYHGGTVTHSKNYNGGNQNGN